MVVSREFTVRKITKIKGIILLASILCLLDAHAAWKPEVVESNTPEAIVARIQPIGELNVEGDDGKPKVAVPQALSADAGKKRYESTCAVCHGAGIAGAPKFRNNSDWKGRVAEGMDTMLNIAIQGKGQMPPKGTCMSCSEEEIKMAIKYMIPQ